MRFHFIDIFKKRRSVAIGAGALLLGVLVFCFFPTREPYYKGKPLTFWLDQARWWSTETNDESAQAIRAMGTNAVPRLVNILGTPSTRIRQKIIFWINRQRPFLNKFKMPADRHWQATIAFRLLGTNAQSAVAPLGRFLRLGRNPGYVSTSLAAIGPSAIDVLTQAIQHTDFNVQTASVAALCSMQKTAFPALPVLLKLMEEGNPTLREMIAVSLAKIDLEAPTAIPVLVKQLQNKDISIQLHAAMALKEYGPRAKAAIPQLIKMIKDPELKVREQAVLAVCKIDFETATKEGLHPENMN